MSARLSWSLRWRLSVLWILEWAISGTVLTYLPLYLTETGVSAGQQGKLLAITAIGLWVAPLVVGQVADRWMASEKYLAVSHFVGGLVLFAIPFVAKLHEQTGEHFSALLTLFGIYAVAYLPTVPLATSLTFRHLPDPDTQFGKVRIWGTVGWMLAGFGLSVWLGRSEAYVWLVDYFPDWEALLVWFSSTFAWVPPPSSPDCFRIAALLSFALSSFCVFLPPTPPARSSDNGIAPLQFLSMFRNPAFSFLIGISFLLSLVIPLYTLQVPKLLEQLGFSRDWIPAVMLVGQISEFPALLFLPLFLKRLGLKTTFAVGMAAWFIRYTFFSFLEPTWLILLGLALHGVCHVFLIIVIQLYVDSQCRRDLRASAQNVFAFITVGLGMPIGFFLGGRLGQIWYDEQTQTTNYQVLFAIPAAVILLLLVIFWKWFRPAPHDDGGGERPLAAESQRTEFLHAHQGGLGK